MYECSYCHKPFSTEARFMSHKCKTMERMETMQTIVGQIAYAQYCMWMRMYKRSEPPVETFMISKYYGAFINFAEYSKKMKLPDIEIFIKMMIEQDFSPHLWTNDKVYALYLEYIDRRTTPFKQASITINTLLFLADAAEVDVSEIFTLLNFNEVLQLIRERKLSPWILLTSVKFKQLIMNSSPEQQQLFKELIRPMYWKIKFDNNPNVVSSMKQMVKEMGI